MAGQASGDGTGSGTPIPLARALGISDGDVQMLGELFSAAAASLGVRGEPIFEKLAAGKSFGEALAVPKRVLDLLYLRAHQWFATGHYERAETVFRSLCLLDGKTADHWVGYGICLRLREAWDEAQVAFETAARLRPAWAVPAFHKLELFLRREAWPNARRALAEFDARADAAIPASLRTEAERYRTALALRGGKE